MKKFLYENDGEETRLEAADMDMLQIAAEIGRITNHFYTSLHRQEPEAARQFKTAVLIAIAHPDSPVWVPQNPKDGSTEILMLGRK